VGKEPLIFKIGSKMVIPGFENAVLEMNIGDEKEIEVTPDQGYGYRNEQATELSKSAFQDQSVLEVDKEIQVMTNMGPLLVKVLEVNEDKVKVLLNHPLAGKKLFFKIKLLKVLDEKESKEQEDNLKKRVEEIQKAQEDMQKSEES
jgi:FKBP-type peptidyl-prolyl cis-trans isomerase 2